MAKEINPVAKRYASDIDCQAADDGMTEQQHKDDCDINVIVRKLERTGLLEHVNPAVAQYADVSHLPSYQEAFEFVKNANEAFMSLDAYTRERFDNDPNKMIKFLENPANRSEAQRLGLVNPDKPIDNVPASPVQDTPK